MPKKTTDLKNIPDTKFKAFQETDVTPAAPPSSIETDEEIPEELTAEDREEIEVYLSALQRRTGVFSPPPESTIEVIPEELEDTDEDHEYSDDFDTDDNEESNATVYNNVAQAISGSSLTAACGGVFMTHSY